MYFFFLLKQSSQLERQSSPGLRTTSRQGRVTALCHCWNRSSTLWLRRLSYTASQANGIQHNRLRRGVDLREKPPRRLTAVREMRGRYLVSARTSSEETVGDGAITTMGSPSTISSHSIWI